MAEEYNSNRVIGGGKWWDSGAGFRSMYGEPSPIKGFSLDQFSHTSSVDSSGHGGLSSPTFIPTESQVPAAGMFQVFMEPPPLQSSGYGGYVNQAAGYGSSDTLMGSTNWINTTPSSLTTKTLNEAPQFFKPSNQQQPQLFNNVVNSHGGSFWNTAANSVDEPRPAAFFPVDPPLAAPTFHDKHHNKNNMMAVKSTNSGGGRKSSLGLDRTSTTATTSTTSTGKRSRNEASSAMPPFKVRKEKMGDRITALQQLVSPFGKTDTASVLSESIEYIKFLHEQVNVLSTPYLKSGASLQLQQQNHNISKDSKKDLRSRGLCLVPISSTFPVAHETTMDFWTPTFGSGPFR